MKKSTLAIVTAAALLVPLLGCSLGQTNAASSPGYSQHSGSDRRWDLDGVQEAVIAADPRITGVSSIKPTLSGLNRGLEILFTVQDDTPVSPEVLREVIAAAWQTTSHGLDMMALIADVEESDGTQTADLQAAATQLVGEGHWTATGQGGITIMSETIEKLISAQ